MKIKNEMIIRIICIPFGFVGAFFLFRFLTSNVSVNTSSTIALKTEAIPSSAPGLSRDFIETKTQEVGTEAQHESAEKTPTPVASTEKAPLVEEVSGSVVSSEKAQFIESAPGPVVSAENALPFEESPVSEMDTEKATSVKEFPVSVTSAEKPSPAEETSEEAVFPPLRVNGILSTKNGNIALINDIIVREGDSILGAKVTCIYSNYIEVEMNGQKKTIRVK